MNNGGHIPPTGIIALDRRDILRIGSAFQNDIFYKDGARIRPEHARLILTEKEPQLYLSTGQGVSVNLKEGEERSLAHGEEGGLSLPLFYGDEIRIYGLYLKYLGKYLFVDAYYGDLRVSVKEGREELAAYG